MKRVTSIGAQQFEQGSSAYGCGSRFRLQSSRWVVFPVLMAVALLAGKVQAQTVDFTQNSKGSGAVTVQIPLANYPGRGIGLPVTLNYNSSGLWRIGFLRRVSVPYQGFTINRNLSEAIYAEHSTAGWTTSLDVPQLEWPADNDYYYFTGRTFESGGQYPNTFRVARVIIHMPDGSSHELRKSDAVYQSSSPSDIVKTGDFYAVDGSRLRYHGTSATSGTLYLADGSKYVFSGDIFQYMDRNGNYVQYNGQDRQWHDTLNRPISMPWPATPEATSYTYSLPGIGTSSVNYTLVFAHLSSVLSSGSSQKPIGDYYMNGNTPTATGTTGLFNSGEVDEENPGQYTYVTGRGQGSTEAFDPIVLAQIDLPNGLHYHFTYNGYGELDKVIYPTGGYQRYAYGVVPTFGGLDGPYGQAMRGATVRAISPSGSGNDEAVWNYMYSTNLNTVTAPNGVCSETYLFNQQFLQTNNFGYMDARNGQPIEQRIYSGACETSTMLRRSLTEYEQSSTTNSKPNIAGQTGTYTAYRNPRAVKTVDFVLDTNSSNALASMTTTGYNTGASYELTVGLEQTSSARYNYFQVDQDTAKTAAITAFDPQSMTPVLTTQTSYKTDETNYRDRNILGLATGTVISDGYGATLTQTTVGYDEQTLIASGSADGWTDPGTSYRGNPTSLSHWLDFPSAAWLSTHVQYDQFGNACKSWDARDTEQLNPTQIDYSQTFDYAFPTTTTTAIPDTNGAFASSAGLVSHTSYDRQTGLVLSTTDPNGQSTYFEYNDPLNRNTKVIRSDGGWTATYYGDTSGNFVRTRVLQDTQPTEVAADSYQYFDGIGRTTRSFAYENQDSTHPWLTVDTQYDLMGRVSQVSSPYRSTGPGSTPSLSGAWTTTGYDLLGRANSVTTPDGSVATTSYVGNTVTVTDQAGRQRRSISDAFGRMIEVDEPNATYGNLDSGGSALQSTYYLYDPLGRLRRVNQGGQHRYFRYDSLGRLVRASYPEQVENPQLNTDQDPISSNTTWSAGFTYDNNGNIATRTDARNITTIYGYDALNRPTTVTYGGGAAKDIERHYDNPTPSMNGKGRFWKANQDANGNNTRFDSYAEVTAYDVVGRPRNYVQRFYVNGVATTDFTVSRNYDYAGHVRTQTYPSTKTVTYTYDIAGRLNSFSGDLGGDSRNYSTGISYSQFGGLQQEQFGTDSAVYNKLLYNNRGQLAEIRVGSTPNNTNFEFGAIINHYSNQPGCWGAACSATDNNGTLQRQDNWIKDNAGNITAIYTQNFKYDYLNRLTEVWEGDPAQGGYHQYFDYDRWGNRTINGATTGGVNNKTFAVDTATNRLYAPNDPSHSLIDYDEAGNQKTDNYTGGGSRAYNAENHLTSAENLDHTTSNYVYDFNGRRIRRNINGVETWQLYGMDGELLAEYAANGTATSPSTPTKEYGYRGGQLLVVVTPGSSGWGAQPTIDDNPLKNPDNPDSWIVKAKHITQLRTAIDMVRAHYHLPQYQWHRPTIIDNTVYISWEPIDEMRKALDQALGPPTPKYADGLAAQQPILAVHIQELRDRVTHAWQNSSTTDIRWLVADHLGTPRIVINKTGTLDGLSRHDYLPFGEELVGNSGRDYTRNYIGGAERQKFTGYEADDETGLNFAQARYQSNVQGRFTSVDPLGASAAIVNPQSMNRYSYVQNNPVNAVDPTGMALKDIGVYQLNDPEEAATTQKKADADFQGAINAEYAAARGGSAWYDSAGGAHFMDDALSMALNTQSWDPQEVPFYGYQDEQNQIFWLPPKGVGPYCLPKDFGGTSVDPPDENVAKDHPDYKAINFGTSLLGPDLAGSLKRDTLRRCYLGVSAGASWGLPVSGSITDGYVYNMKRQRTSAPQAVENALTGTSYNASLALLPDYISGSVNVDPWIEVVPTALTVEKGNAIPLSVGVSQEHAIRLPWIPFLCRW